jgi:hypothetical protein
MSTFSTATLCTDEDLTAQESRQPAAAKAVKAPSGKTAYDGKIALAKEAVDKRLRKLGFHPDGILTPSQLLRAAVYKTLELMYRDMASRNDSVSWDKAKYYADSFEEEITTLSFDFDESMVPATPTVVSGVTSIPCLRA